MRRAWNALVTIVTGLAVVLACLWLLRDPRSPLPDAWNPLTPLDLAAPVTPWTSMKLRRAAADPMSCLAAIIPHADVQSLPPLVGDGGCGIDPRVAVTRVGQTRLSRVETTCAVALRLAAWERFVVQPAAAAHLGSGVARFRHQSSYNCRMIRTESGPGTRLSTHATAEAIDIAGVHLTDGRRLELIDHWAAPTPEADFFRALHTGACEWFVTVLGPDFNALHADHFHMQSVGWGACR
ncbi:MAG: extensin family protein [Pseudomonadota bacterium]